jgi:hypothetical protein
VGWDFSNIENRTPLRKDMLIRSVDDRKRQNGLTTTKITIPIIKRVGTSLIIR